MNDRALLILIQLLIGFNCQVLAQRDTFVGFEAAFCKDLYTVQDDGSSLKTVPLNTGFCGINIRHQISTKFFTEISFLFKPYWEGIGFKNIPVWSSNDAFNAILIPLKVGYQIKLAGQFFLTPAAGLAVGINTSPDLGSYVGPGRIKSGAISIEYFLDVSDDVERCFLMVQPSLAIERELFKVLLASVSITRPFGFNKANELDITYTINGSTPIEGRATNRGDYWSVGLALRYPVTKLWRKR